MYANPYGQFLSGGIWNGIKNSFRHGSALTRLIYINVGVFFFLKLVEVFLVLAGYQRVEPLLLVFTGVPALPEELLYTPWTALTYMFTHFGFLHLLFNMLWLYWFGKIFLFYFNGRQLGGLYIIGGIAGALLFILSYNIFPYFEDNVIFSSLVGASASVMAIVFAISFYQKDYAIDLLFFGRIKLLYLALFTIAIDMLTITSGNAGGHIAHIGGALTGIGFASLIKNGKDITNSINKVIDVIVNLGKKRPKMKVTYKRPETDYEYNTRKQQETETIDRILDKLKHSGYESLSSEEKKRLFDASKK